MMTPIEFYQKHPDFSLLTQIVYPKDQGFQTRVCFHNYFERVLRRPVSCELLYFVFNQDGVQVDFGQKTVGSDCSVQIDVSEKISGLGTVAVAVLPDFDLKDLEAQGLVPRRPQAAGYYMLWENPERAWIDTSHEWAVAQKAKTASSRFFVHLPADRFLNKRSIVVYNPNLQFATDVRVQEKFSSRETVFNLAPMAVREVFSQAGVEQDADFTVTGEIVAPFSVEYHQTGDLHIHHS